MTTETNLKKLEKMLAVMDGDTLTRSEFMKAFENVVNYVMKIQQNQQEAINRLEATYQNLIKKFQGDYSMGLGELKRGVNELFVRDRLEAMGSKTRTNFEALKREVNDLFSNKIKDIDFKVGNIKPIKGDRGDAGLPGLPGKIDMKILEDLNGKMKRFEKAMQNIPRGGSRGKIPILRVIDLTASVDGSTTTFTVPQDTVTVHLVWSTQFPIILRPTIDFTLSGTTLTLVTSQVGTMQSGQTVVALIETLFYAG